jgi:hypothetical protein
MLSDSIIDSIAQICHEANRAYCKTVNDHTQAPWETAPEWQRQSARNGVRHAVANPDAGPEASHNSWLEEKRADGWSYGAMKDSGLKTHPCFVSYDELPEFQRRKDSLFIAIVRALAVV